MAKLLSGTRIYGTATVDTALLLSGTAASASTTTGALQVAGGIGLGGSIYAGGLINTPSLVASIATISTLTVSTTATFNSLDVISLRASGPVLLTSSTNASSTVTGALVVTGGIGIGQNLYVGGNIYTNGNQLVGAQSNTSTNLAGGAQGSIPIQSAGGLTSFIPLGNAGYVLTAGATTASWTAITGLTAGNATTATNLAGGTSGQIPYQTGPGATSFIATSSAGNILVSNNTGAPSYSNTVSMYGDMVGINVTAGKTLDITAPASHSFNNNAAIRLTSSSATSYGAQLILNSSASTSGKNYSLVSSGSLDSTGAGPGNFYILDTGLSAVRMMITAAGNILIGSTSTRSSYMTGGNTPKVQIEGTDNNNSSFGIVRNSNDTSGGNIVIAKTRGTAVGTTATVVTGDQIGSFKFDASDGFNLQTVASISASVTGTVAVSQMPGKLSFATAVAGSNALNEAMVIDQAQVVRITNSTNATNTTTGILVVTGGVGIGGNLYVGGSINATSLTGNITTASNLAGGATGSVPYQSATGTTAFLALAGTVGSIKVAGSTAPQYATNVLAISGSGSLVSNAGQSLRVTSGGLGVTGDSYFGNSIAVATNVSINGLTNATSTNSGVLTVAGGAGFAADVYVGGKIYATATNALLATTATHVAGGASGSLPYQTASSTTAFLSIGTNGFVLTSNGSAPSWSALSGLSAGNATTATNIAGGTAGQLHYQTGPGATSFVSVGSAGNLLMSAGAAVPVYTSTANIYIGYSTNAINTNITDDAASATAQYITFVNASSGFQGQKTNSASFTYLPSTGRVTAPSLYLTSASASTATTSSNALYVQGGAYLGSLFVAQDTTFGGSVTFAGTTTNVASTNTFYTDNLIEVHTPPGGPLSAWAVDDGKDIGLRFSYYKTADAKSAIWMDNANQYLNWGVNVTTGSNTISANVYGTIRTGSLILTTGTTAVNTGTGALIVQGGAGFGRDVYIGGSLTVSGGINATITGVSTTATNLAGGTTGQIPYQTATGVTSFFGPGTAGQILVSNGASVPGFYNTGTLHVGTAQFAVTASNIAVVNDVASSTPQFITFVSTSTSSVSIKTAATNGLVYTPSTGYLGIGTASPADAVDAGAGNFRTTGYYIARTSARARLYNQANTNYSDIYNPETGSGASIAFRSGAGEAMRIDTASNVGIGTTTPTANLHVVGGHLQTGIFTSTNLTNATNTITGAIQTLGGLAVAQNAFIGGSLTVYGTINASVTGAATSSTNVNITNDVATSTPQYITFVNTSTGYAGVKTAATGGLTFIPSTSGLGVGTTASLGNSLLNVAQGIALHNVGAVNPYVQLFNNTAPANQKTWRIGGASSGQLTIETINDAYVTAVVRIYIDNSGNFGIGSTAPTANLDVVGGQKVSGIFTSSNVTNASNTSSGAIQTLGGLAVGKDIHFGGNLYQNGILFTGGGSGSTVSNVYMYNDNATTAPRYITFASTSTGSSQIFTAATNGLVFQPSTGNINIGTGAAFYNKLYVQGGATTTGTINSYALGVGGSGTQDLTLGADGSYSYIQSNNSKPLVINPSGNLTALNGWGVGNVSVGSLAATFTTGGGLYVKNATQSNVRVVSSTFTGFDHFQDTAGNGGLNVRDNAALVFYTNNTEVGRFQAGGNFGVGSASPIGKLHVAGDAYVTGIITGTNTTNATNSTTGALQLAGGAGIRGDVFIGSNLTVQGTFNGTVGAATNVTVTNDTASNTPQFIAFLSTSTGNSGVKTAATSGLTFVPNVNRFGVGVTTPAYGIDIAADIRVGGSSGLGYYNNSNNSGFWWNGYGTRFDGIWLDTTNNKIIFRKGNTDSVFVIDSNNNIGIGTASPTAVSTFLTIDARGTSGSAIRLGTASALQYIYGDATGLVLATGGGLPVIFQTNATQRMQIDSSGYVSIGTSSAMFGTAGRGVLNVNGSSNAIVSLSNGGSTSNAGYLYWNGTDLILAANNTTGGIVFSTNAATEYMRLDYAGNLGIGMTPTYKVDITGGMRMTGVFTNTNATQSVSSTTGALYVAGGAGIVKDVNIGGILTVWGGINATVTGISSSATTVAVTNDNATASAQYITFVGGSTGYQGIKTAATTGMTYIPSLGNVGIGTATPRARLEVNGGLQVTGIFTATAGVNATNNASGSLQVTGGVGITQDIYVGGRLYGTASTATMSTVYPDSVTASAQYITFSSANTGTSGMLAAASNTSMAYVPSTGNIGFGTATPLQKVEVTGNMRVNGAFTATSIFVGPWAISTSSGGGGASVTVSDTAPASPSAGNLWWDSAQGNLRIYYTDGDSSQWVDAVATLVGPQGVQGIQGATGASGPQGVNTSTTATFIIFDTTIATSTSTGALQVRGGVGIGNNMYVQSTATFLGQSVHPFYQQSNSTATGSIIASGGIGAGGNIYSGGLISSPAMSITSSIKTKQGVKPIKDALKSILLVDGVTYYRKSEPTKLEAGFIAEEMYKVLPHLVTLDSNGDPAGIHYANITAYLVESIKELKAEIDELKRSRG